MITRRGFLAGAAAFAASRAWAGTSDFSLKNARILVGDGTETQGGVRVESGRIVEVGPGVTSGEDLGGAVLFPGFYEAGSTLGLVEIDLEPATHDEREGSDAITPQARVVDGYNPLSELIPVARLSGVLGALVMPSGGLVGGQAAWMRLAGDVVSDVVLKEPAGVVINLGHGGTGEGANAPRSRMGVAMKLRDLFDANKPPGPDDGKKKKGKGKKPEDLTRAQKTVRALRGREMKAIFTAERADDIVMALDLAKEFELDAVLTGCAEGHLVAGRLADAKLPILLGPVTVQPESFDTLHARYENAAILHRAGVRFALRKGSPHQARDIVTEADVAVANGLPWDVAIAAVTGNGPAFWGLSVGQLKPGFEASFVRADGDPLQPRTRITGIWMRGAPVPLTSRQTELYEKFRTLR